MRFGHFALPTEACHVIESNWDALLDLAKDSGKELRSLIKRKRDEIQILQDGVSIVDVHYLNSSRRPSPSPRGKRRYSVDGCAMLTRYLFILSHSCIIRYRSVRQSRARK